MHLQIDCKAGEALTLSYEVYAFDPSVRTAWLDARRGFFNGTSLCLRVHGQEDQPHQLALHPVKGHPDWQVATGLTPIKTDKRGFGLYQAADYDELVDCPVEMGTFWSGSFKACGIEHRFVVAGACLRLTGLACWPTHKRSVKPKSVFGTATAHRRVARRPTKTMCSCSTLSMTAMAGWSTATARP